MRKSRFIKEQIIAILGEQARGEQTAEVCGRQGISSATFEKWKSLFGGMELSDARKLKSLETENARLKRLLAEQMLDNTILMDLSGIEAVKQTGTVPRRWRRWKLGYHPSGLARPGSQLLFMRPRARYNLEEWRIHGSAS